MKKTVQHYIFAIFPKKCLGNSKTCRAFPGLEENIKLYTNTENI